MLKKHIIHIMMVAGFISMPPILSAQEFPVAAGRDSTFSAGAAWGGSTGIVVMIGDTLGQYNVTAQRVSPPTNVIGNRISIGRAGTFPGPMVAFDGTNFLLVWRENNGNINGQFINTSGILVGTYFTIGTNASSVKPGLFGLLYMDTTYLVGYVKAADSCLYGQRVSRSGALLGGQIKISNNRANGITGSYDGTNWLAVWVDYVDGQDHDFYGQFISKTGALVGGNFLIDGGPNTTENGLSLAFDGTRYLLIYPDEDPNTHAKNLIGRFMTTAGSVVQTILICDAANAPNMPSLAFDNSNYLITWSQFTDFSLMGQFWTPAGAAFGAPFVIFDTLNGRFPIGGCGYGGGWFLVVGSRINTNFTDGDVYGSFIPHTGIKHDGVQRSGNSVKLQNRPNPFNATTDFSFDLSSPSFVSLKVFDVAGRETATVVSEQLPAGSYVRQWQASGVAGGVYFYRLQAGAYTETKALLLHK